FSPDGNELAFTQAEPDGKWHIWMVPAQGGSPRQLTSGAIPEIYPRFSPDGSSVFYHSWNPGAERIWRVPRAGGPAEAIASSAGNYDDEYADVSPDARWVAFARVQKNSTRVYVAPLSGGDRKSVV